MKLTGWSFIEHEKKLRIEGFDLHKLLEKCRKKKIFLRNIKIISEFEMEAVIKAYDMKALKKCAGQTYLITEQRESGYMVLLDKLKNKKIMLIGIIVFLIFIYIQSLFVKEIRIYGYESIPEETIRQTLAHKGFKEGALKLRTLEEVEELELYLFQELEDIVYAKIEYNGCMAIVTIAESKGEDEKDYAMDKNDADINNNTDKNSRNTTSQGQQTKEGSPSNIISEIDGYVFEIIPENGLRAVPDGAFVKKGDVLISGVVPLKSTAYGTGTENITEMYVKAAGTAKLKVPERIIFYLEKYDIIKEPTGKTCYGLEIGFEIDINNAKKHVDINTQDIAKSIGRKTNNLIGGDYEACLYDKRVILEKNGGNFAYIAFNKREEVEIFAEKRDENRLKELSMKKIRKFMKENKPKNTVISNLSLNFTEKENIIIVMAFLETIEETGKEEEIIFDEIIDRQ